MEFCQSRNVGTLNYKGDSRALQYMFCVKAKWDFINYFPDYMKKFKCSVKAWMPRYPNFDALSNGKKNSSSGLQIPLQGSQCKIHVRYDKGSDRGRR